MFAHKQISMYQVELTEIFEVSCGHMVIDDV